MDYVRDLDADDYDELVEWLREEADKASDRKSHGEGSMDMDAYVQAKAAKALESGGEWTDGEWEEGE